MKGGKKLTIIISALKIIFLLGFLILIHEAGHLIVAKLCKVKVNEFAIGFGPTIWKKQGKETKYALRLIPLRWILQHGGRRRKIRKCRVILSGKYTKKNCNSSSRSNCKYYIWIISILYFNVNIKYICDE